MALLLARRILSTFSSEVSEDTSGITSGFGRLGIEGKNPLSDLYLSLLGLVKALSRLDLISILTTGCITFMLVRLGS